MHQPNETPTPFPLATQAQFAPADKKLQVWPCWQMFHRWSLPCIPIKKIKSHSRELGVCRNLARQLQHTHSHFQSQNKPETMKDMIRQVIARKVSRKLQEWIWFAYFMHIPSNACTGLSLLSCLSKEPDCQMDNQFVTIRKIYHKG